MWENCVYQFFFGGFQVYGDNEVLDQFGYFCVIYMGIEQFIVVFVEDYFDQIVVFFKCNGFIVGIELILVDLDVVVFGFCFFFG